MMKLINSTKFLAELKELIKRNKITEFSFCGQFNEKNVGMIGMGGAKYGDFFNSLLRVGGLYQAGRERSRTILDQYEK